MTTVQGLASMPALGDPDERRRVLHLRVSRSTSAWYCFRTGPADLDTSGVALPRNVRVVIASSLRLVAVSS